MEVFVRNLVQIGLMAVWLLVLGRVLMSWIDPTGRSQLGTFLVQTTEPILGPVRRILPQSGMFDFAPLLVLLVLGALWRAF